MFDPEEKFACWNYGGGDKTEFADNDGGQRMPGDRWETCRSFENLTSGEYTVGKSLAHDFGPDMNVPEYSYLKGDITNAYSDKVKEMKRSFVFLNFEAASEDAETCAEEDAARRNGVPAVLIVFDKTVSADPDFRKYWLLHSIEEPQIEGNTFTIDRTLNGDSGRLHDTVLLPAADNLEIRKVGGPGHEFDVFGVNYPNEPRNPDPANERGAWRVEVSPAAPAEEDIFLNVIQVTDTESGDLLSVRMISGKRIAGGSMSSVMTANGEVKFASAAWDNAKSPVTGVAVADRVVTFSTEGAPLGGSFSISLACEDRIDERDCGLMKILLTDLLPGTWQILKDGKIFIPACEVREGEGTLYFEGESGEYEFRR